ncbi:putative plasma membrane proteolipid 3, partial [Syncephalis pseudoplumigaleata]
FTTRDIAIGVLGIFVPPVGVLLREGCGMDFCINLLLTLLGYVFGVVHCWYIVLRH